ncbi:MAG TPA: glycosyltransferase family 87 protein [Candidatus Krumholzibacteria bacterium]|nr:glycosyltransferase family 87 protein [Candidatus Krumholzibacteria bacterium]
MSVESEFGRRVPDRRRFLKQAALSLVCACWLGVFLSVWVRVDGYQWDFKTYFYASRALDRGLNPYQVPALAQVAGEGSHPLRFVYPLTALYLMRPLAQLDYATAHRIWLLIKAGAIIGLISLWKRVFLRDVDWLWILVVGLFAFQAATIWDIKAGNVSTLEQLLLWSGFACLVRGRPVAFAGLVVAAALFKLTLAAFLILLLVSPNRGRRGTFLFASAFLLLAVVTAGSFAGHPGYFRDFVRAASSTPAWLESNPSAFGVAVELARRYPAVFGVSAAIPYALWLLFSGGVLILGRRLIVRALRSQAQFAVLVACFCYALVAPRMMIYSYMILIVPVLGLLLPSVKSRSMGVYAVAALLCLDGLRVLPADIGRLAQDCQPLILLLASWFFLVYADARNLLREPAL